MTASSTCRRMRRWASPMPPMPGLDDPVIEINLTPNRPDCTSIHGIARDLAAAGLGTLKHDASRQCRGRGPVPRLRHASISPRATRSSARSSRLRLVRGVKNGPSPEWMQRRLAAIGLRPINALVDITNYITFDRGRPLHVFDAAKVKGGLTVRRAQDGEEMLALDGKTYRLDRRRPSSSPTRTASNRSPASWAASTRAATRRTTDVLIESALWDPLNIAQSGRRLGIITDARYRFERGVDPAFTRAGPRSRHPARSSTSAAARPTEVVAGGQGAGAPTTIIDFPWSEVAAAVGPRGRSALNPGTILETARLRRRPDRATALSVTPPSWRPDIEGKADLVEEVIRIVGLDRIEPRPLPRLDAAVAKPILTVIQKSHAPRQAHARGPRPRRGRDLVVRRPRRGRALRRRRARARAGQPDRVRSLRHAAEPSARASQGRAAQRRPRASATSPCSRSASASRPTSPRARRSGRRPSGAARRMPEAWAGTGTAGAAAVDAFDAKADALCAPDVPRRSGRRPAGRGRRAGLVPSRPFRHAAVRPEERGRRLRRDPSAGAARPSTSRVRWWPSSSPSTRCPRPRPGRPR